MDGLEISKENACYPGDFMFGLLEKAEITPAKKEVICGLLDKLIQYLTSNSNSPFQRKGAGLTKFSDLLKIVYSNDNFNLLHMENIKRCYRVHVASEDAKKSWKKKQEDKEEKNNWNSRQTSLTDKAGKILSYWCFNPGFGMMELVRQGVKCLLITSGTLSPIKAFTEELQVGFQ